MLPFCLASPFFDHTIDNIISIKWLPRWDIFLNFLSNIRYTQILRRVINIQELVIAFVLKFLGS